MLSKLFTICCLFCGCNLLEMPLTLQILFHAIFPFGAPSYEEVM